MTVWSEAVVLARDLPQCEVAVSEAKKGLEEAKAKLLAAEETRSRAWRARQHVLNKVASGPSHRESVLRNQVAIFDRTLRSFDLYGGLPGSLMLALRTEQARLCAEAARAQAEAEDLISAALYSQPGASS